MSSRRACDRIGAPASTRFSTPVVWTRQRFDHRHWKIAMTIFVPGPTSRRAFLAGVTGLVVAARIPHVAAEDSKPVKEFKLTATAGRVALVGKPHPDTNVWCYDGRVPGPEIRLRQGEPARIIV